MQITESCLRNNTVKLTNVFPVSAHSLVAKLKETIRKISVTYNVWILNKFTAMWAHCGANLRLLNSFGRRREERGLAKSA